jgi:hypothetical protein
MATACRDGILTRIITRELVRGKTGGVEWERDQELASPIWTFLVTQAWGDVDCDVEDVEIDV